MPSAAKPEFKYFYLKWLKCCSHRLFFKFRNSKFNEKQININWCALLKKMFCILKYQYENGIDNLRLYIKIMID